jgi:hypothetical protein
MPHVAPRTRRTRTTANRPTTPGMHLAAMRMSRLRKSFGWRTSMGAAVADAPPCSYTHLFFLPSANFPISTYILHSSTLTVVYFAFGW